MPHKDELSITNLQHPVFTHRVDDWIKWRLAYGGGRDFRESYLKKFSAREEVIDFAERKAITYVPSFAKSAINEVKNSIFERAAEVVRRDGTPSYQLAISGKGSGVDLHGNSMNSFIGKNILPELLIMGKVGTFIDMPVKTGPSIAEAFQDRPYIYHYKAEQIQNWSYDRRYELTNLLLKDCDYFFDEKTDLPCAYDESWRHLYIGEDRKVHAQFYDKDGKPKFNEPIIIDLPIIPFVIFELTDSLMEDIADYQIALMNISSSDLAFILKSNYPFYTEQFDSRVENSYLKKSDDTAGPNNGNKTVDLGTTQGRRYPQGLDRPDFIHPSPEPLMASMAKQQQLKEEIRLLVNLSLTNIRPARQASAESKSIDEHSLEAGLAYIGLELQHGERQIAKIWNAYEGSKNEPTIKYPQRYSLESDTDKQAKSKAIKEMMNTVPSLTFRREMAKQLATITLAAKIPDEVLEKIHQEIDKATVLIGDVEVINRDVQDGFLDTATAAAARGYPEGTAEKAKKDHAERLAAISVAQGGQGGPIQGVPDTQDAPAKNGQDSKIASQNPVQNVGGKQVRGNGK